MKTHDWESVKRMLTIIGTTLSWAFTSLLFLIFYLAVFHPSNQVLIDVNAYEEMGIESVIFALMWIAVTANMVITWKGKAHDSKSKRAQQTLQSRKQPVTFAATPYIYNKETSDNDHNEAWYESIKQSLRGEENATTGAEAATSRR